jgi:peroxiredoxin Q/BCP
MSEDYAAYTAREAEILAVGPNTLDKFEHYWAEHNIPFIGLPDPKHLVAKIYKQEVNLLKLGRMPALMLVDKNGYIRYQHYGTSMSDIPDNVLILKLLEKI